MSSRAPCVLRSLLVLSLVVASSPMGRGATAVAAPSPQLGAVRLQVTTASDAARRDFIAGLAALHSFWYEQALEYFQRAVEADPGFAMGCWGIAQTYNHPLWGQQDAPPAREALTHVGDLDRVRAEERGLIEALRLLYDDGLGDKLARDTAYSQAMGELHAEFPGNDEIAAFYALSILGTVRPADERGSRVKRQMQAGAIALDLYARHPDHPGAAHYVIHSFDDPEHAILALPAAVRYAEIAPAAYHARHMPSHIFVQLGMWREATASNESSYGTSFDWVGREHLDTGLRDWHSYTWLNYVYLQQGRFSDSRRLIDDALADARANPTSRIPGIFRGLVAAHVIESEDWEAIDALQGLEGDDAYSGGNDLLLARSFAAAARGDHEAGAGIVARLRDDAGRLAAQPDRQYDARRTELFALIADGQLQAAQGDLDAAIGMLEEATAIEEAQAPPSGPTSPMKPSHELLGELLLRAGQPERAAEMFDTALFRQPNRGRSLLGLARARAARGDSAGAAEAYRRFLDAWDPADRGRPELTEAQAYVRRISAR